MSGEDFYAHLQEIYKLNGKRLYGNYSFEKWLLKNDNTASFQFMGKTQKKAIPKKWIIKAVEAIEANGSGFKIDRNWFNIHCEGRNFNDCRSSVARWLINNHYDL